MTRRRWTAGSCGFLLLLLGVGLPAPAARAATIWIWPSLQCNGTLQQCTDLASSGDEVLIEYNGPINQSDTITDKSLTLAAEAGFSPQILVLEFKTTPAQTSALGFLVKDVQVARYVVVGLQGGTGTTVTIDHVTATSSGVDPGIYGSVFVGSTITVENSRVSQTGNYPGIELDAPNANQQHVFWNVIGNTISGELASMTQAGIRLSALNAKSVHAGVYNNSIWDEGQGEAAGSRGGIMLSARQSGHSEFDIVGNSIDRVHGDAVFAENEQMAPGDFGLKLFDNVFSRTSGSAVNLELGPGFNGHYVTDGGHNVEHHTGAADHLRGHSIGTPLTVAPQFVDEANGNLRLQGSSPLIDQGVTCSRGGVAGPDAAHRSRIHGKSVDIGAYEFGAGPAGIVIAGTGGPDTESGGPNADILCGYGGNDKLFGAEGNDYLDGGDGKDTLHGQPGRDRLFGRAGNDRLCARDGTPGDLLDGGPGTDSFQADTTDQLISVEVHATC